MPTTYTSISDLAEEIRDQSAGERIIISVDGFDGSGKSSLGQDLANLIDAQFVDIDHYLVENQGGFLNFIRYDPLFNSIKDHMDTSSCIVAGCCILEVLNHLNIDPTITIYMKYLRADNIWMKGRFLAKYNSPKEAVTAANKELKEFSIFNSKLERDGGDGISNELEISGLRKDLIKYHYDYSPHEIAQIIFERNDSSPQRRN